MDESRLPQRLFLSGCEPSGRNRVNNYFNLRWIENIKKVLDDEHLEQLASSQFAHLMLMGNHTFSVMFVHYLLSRQLVTNKKYELWWVFAGKPIRYALDDFALVTGLNCQKSGFKVDKRRGKAVKKGCNAPSPMWKSLFGSEPKPTVSWIFQKLLIGKKYRDAITRFRLSLLLLVDGILCPTCGNTNISPEHVEMVGDVDAFLKYPWGRDSFLKTVRSAKARTVKQLAQDTCAIQGFSHALVLVTAACCPDIIQGPIFGVDMNEPSFPVEDIVNNICERSLAVNVQAARVVDQTGQARVRSILNTEQIETDTQAFSDEEEDEEVTNLVHMVLEGHPFEHNSWCGGVDVDYIHEVGTHGTTPDDLEEGEDGCNDGDPTQAEDHSSSSGEESTKGKFVDLVKVLKETTNALEERLISRQNTHTLELKTYFDASMVNLETKITNLIKATMVQNDSTDTVPVVHDVRSKGSQESRCGPSLHKGDADGRGVPVNERSCPPNLAGVNVTNVNVDPPTFSIGLTQLEEDANLQAVKGSRQSMCGHVNNEGEAAGCQMETNETPEPPQLSTDHNLFDVNPPTFSIGLTQLAKEGQMPAENGTNSVSPSLQVDTTEMAGIIDLTQDLFGVTRRRSARNSRATSTSRRTPTRMSLRIRGIPGSVQAACEEGQSSGILSHDKPDIVYKSKKKRRTETDNCIGDLQSNAKARPSPMLLVGGFGAFSVPTDKVVADFLKMMETERSYKLGCGMMVDNTEFLKIFEASAFLDESTADLLVKFIQARRDESHSNRFDFLPASFLSELYRQYNRFLQASDKMQFIFSSATAGPFNTRPVWIKDVDILYSPMQIERYHWIGLVIDFKAWQVIALDCNRSRLTDQQVTKYVEHIAVMLPYLIQKYVVTEAASNFGLDRMAILRPSLPFHCSSRALVGVASHLLLELHAVSSLATYYRILDDEQVQIAARQYALGAFDKLSPSKPRV